TSASVSDSNSATRVLTLAVRSRAVAVDETVGIPSNWMGSLTVDSSSALLTVVLDMGASSADPQWLKVLVADLQPVAGTGAIRPQRAVHRVQDAVEGQRLDAHVIGEVLQVAAVPHRGQHMGADLGCAVSGQIEGGGVAERRDAEQTGDPA